MNALLDSLTRVVGAANVLTAAGDVVPYVTDWRGRYSGTALAVVRPADTAEVADVVRLCAASNIAIVPQGGNTGLCGGATPIKGEIILSLTRLNRIRAIDAANNTMTVEAGCTLAAAQMAASGAGRLFPLSLAAEGTATIGGNLSTNAGGVQVLRYGNARELCLGLEAVLPDGRVWNGLRGLRKDNAGYDLKQLFIGAEGTLGVITAAVLKLYPPSRQLAAAWAGVPSPAAAVALLDRLQKRLGNRLTAFELIGRSALDLALKHIPHSRDPLPNRSPWQVLIELNDTLATDLQTPLQEALAEAIAANEVSDAALAHNEEQAREFWRLRESLSEAQKIEGVSIKHDISLPISRIPEFLARCDALLEAAWPGVRVVCFGHLGDGNLHYNPSKPAAQDNVDFIAQSGAVNRKVYDLAASFGGSISAEHGLGQLKREDARHYKDPIEMDLMRAIKKAIDPQGLMNPGKVL